MCFKWSNNLCVALSLILGTIGLQNIVLSLLSRYSPDEPQILLSVANKIHIYYKENFKIKSKPHLFYLHDAK